MQSRFIQSITIIVVGMVGCFLTSMAGIAAVMISRDWASAGGWSEWLHRLSIAYPSAAIVVLIVFPWMVPWLSWMIERWLKRRDKL